MVATRIKTKMFMKDEIDPFFDIRREDLSLSNGTFAGVQALVRTDTNLPVGIVTPQYKLVTHKEASKFATDLLDRVNIKYNIKESFGAKGGAKLYQKIEFPDYRFNPVEVAGVQSTAFDGDAIHDDYTPTIILRNSYDKTEALRFIYGAIRFACTNGCIVGNIVQNVSMKHSGKGSLDRIGNQFLDNLEKTIEGIKVSFNRLNSESAEDYLKMLVLNKLNSLTSKKILEKIPAGLVTTTKDKDNKKYTEVKVNRDFSAYALYNIMTEFATHTVKTSVQSLTLQNTISSVFEV